MAKGFSFGKIKLIDNDTIFSITYDGTVRFIIDKSSGLVTFGAVSGTGEAGIIANALNLTGTSNKIVMEGGVGSYIQVPSLTGLERDALTPEDGYMIYNSTANKFQGYQNGSWVNFV